MNSLPIYQRVTGSDTAVDAVTVSIFKMNGQAVATATWDPELIPGEFVDEPTNMPQPVPDAFRHAEAAMQRLGLVRIVVLLDDAVQWNREWGILI